MANGGGRPRPAIWLLLALLIMAIVGQAVPLYTDWLWFQEVGLAQVFTTTLTLRGWLAIGLAAAVFAFMFANLWLAARTAPPDVLWELEDVEPEVATEQRIHAVERRRVEELDEGVPGPARAHAGHEGDHRDDGQEQPPNHGLENGAVGQTELIFELPQHVRRCGSRGHGEIEEQEREHDAPEPEEEPAVQGQAGGEYLREADFLEPEPVGVQGHGLPQSAHGHEQDEEPEPEAGPPA